MTTPDRTQLSLGLDSANADDPRHETGCDAGDMAGKGPGGQRYDTDCGDTQATEQHFGGGDRPPRWLGLTIAHRRLFDALQCEWLHPPHTDPGTLLGVGRYVTAPNVAPTGGHPIPVRLKLDATKLPVLEVPVLRDQTWMTSRLDALEPSDTALHWPGPLPAFTIAGLSVSTAEERARLVGLAAGISNVELPTDVTVGGDSLDDEGFEPGRPPPDPICAFTLPNGGGRHPRRHEYGAVGGAAHRPVVELADDLLGGRSYRVAREGQGDWRIVVAIPAMGSTAGCPAARPAGGPLAGGRRCLQTPNDRRPYERRRTGGGNCGPGFAFRARRNPGGGVRMAAGDPAKPFAPKGAIQLEGWKTRPVDWAIQLVLNRPNPDRFPDMVLGPAEPIARRRLVRPPRCAACSTAHRRLDTSFRGKALQRELVSIHAMRPLGR